ncbi:MAG: biopolymer transporter ExbD [Pyrinomonadaceae bacterium]|nr:biopolymer transporter ExbD [Acidobacteriota bacterium]MBK7934243.1 biopolymer transporter ExbD [Acidobacteriota bacterium]MBP7375270.1 biopolymer transporter ExbD [Pyrinomonadaceae bacterium]
MTKPNINVTPLIDVLLVLLIIFMVVSPLKPSSFRARVPAESKNDPNVALNINTLVAVVENDGSLRLNNESNLGTTTDTAVLTKRLQNVFAARIESGQISERFADDADRPIGDRIERTVFIKAPRTVGYGEVARVVDAVKLAGAYPIGLQIDDLP